MFIQTFLIAGGNSTALVADCPAPQKTSLIDSLLDQVEQVGFVDHACDLPRIRMMGGEFCINATLAFASTLGAAGCLNASGVNHPVRFANCDRESSIRLPLNWCREDNIILLEGIGFALWDGKSRTAVEKDEIKTLCMRYNLPAFGAILFDQDAITPYVYVPGVDSFVAETACGSGSVALHLYTGITRIRQPTGQYISIRHDQEFHISARVTPMGPGHRL